MIFNSFEFAVFLPIVFIVYWFLLNRNLKLQNLFIVGSSYLFYGWWDWRFLSLIIFSTLLDFIIGKKIYKVVNDKKRKYLLNVSLFLNLGFLCVFKYFNFFIDSFATTISFLGYHIDKDSISLQIVLPVGISFYTFQTLSYTIDVYRKRLVPTNDFIVFAAFVSFFPQLVAGPIERASHLINQFEKPRQLKLINIQFGFIRILWGLFKKAVIADRLAPIVNEVFNDPKNHLGYQMIIAIIFFAVQIYCDFSGYSDIAIGTSRVFGFKLMENFKMPYLSKSLGEFWRNWHISLSTWFRDYIYIPMGGNRVGQKKWIINLLVTFTISGLWHGAAWTFVIWGAIHGMILIVENKLNIKKSFNGLYRSVIDIMSTLFTFIIICIAWVFFRANSLNDTFIIFKNLFNFSRPLSTNIRGQILYMNNPLWKFLGILMLIVFLYMIEIMIKKGYLNEFKIIKQKLLVRWGVYSLLILVILIFGVFDIDQFIYFQF